MTDLLDKAMEKVRRLDPSMQDEIARAIMLLAGIDEPSFVTLSIEEREAVARSQTAAVYDDFATDEEVAAIWAKHGL